MRDEISEIHALFEGAPETTEFRKLRKRIVRYTREAIEQYGMIERGARWLVCLYGGKDSYTHAQTKSRYRRDYIYIMYIILKCKLSATASATEYLAVVNKKKGSCKRHPPPCPVASCRWEHPLRCRFWRHPGSWVTEAFPSPVLSPVPRRGPGRSHPS